MESGKIVAFFEQKRILCAVCLEVKGNKIHLLSEENREISLGLNRIVHASSSSLKSTLPRESLVETLKKIVERQRELMDSISIQDLWELVWEERREFNLRELAELTFSSQITFDHEMALTRRVLERGCPGLLTRGGPELTRILRLAAAMVASGLGLAGCTIVPSASGAHQTG